MIENRSMPRASVMPVLIYKDVDAAVNWLCAAFGFTERWRAGGHRAQLAYGAGALVVAEPSARGQGGPSAVLVRVDDVDAHHAQACDRGAKILQPPTDHPYGERQYTAVDPAGHRWTFSQSIADLAPEDWGATSANLG